MTYNPELIKDKNIYPMTIPDNAGKTRKMSIEPNTFGDDCETIEFKYVAGKGEFLTFNADFKTFEMIMGDLELALRKREPAEITYEQSFKNKPSAYITVGRKDDGVPFIRIKATTKMGTERNKEFVFPLPRNINILRNGQPLNDLEKQERSCRAFLKTQHIFVESLKAQYRARVWQQNGNFGNANGNQNNNYGNQNNNYGNQNNQNGNQNNQNGNYGNKPQESDSDFNEMFS